MLNDGEVLNERYRVERVVGQGGMGAVYLATHLQLDERVAIKEMLLAGVEPAQRAACEQQFRVEARILNRLRHRNLPRVYDFFELQERHYLVMEFIQGGTLESILQKGPIAEARVLQWARELCEVLAYLHSNNPPVIFRDLKPANIMLAEDGSIRLIDFGIAKVFEPDEGASTRTVLRGAASHGFAAPEQYGVGGTDARSDIYSLGATLYTLLTREVPPPAMELAAGMVSLVPLTRYRNDVSEKTVAAIEWMMQVHREMRPPHVLAVQEALGLSRGDSSRASLPAQMRQVVREEFHEFFPARQWLDRRGVLKTLVSRLVEGLAHPPMLAMVGEPGLGKSRLLQEVARKVGDDYEVLPVAHGAPAIRQQPFGLLIPAVSAWTRANLGDVHAALAGLDPQELSEASHVIPELKPLVKEDVRQRGPVERARSVLTVVHAILEEAAREVPALLLLDDMQWCDDATLRLLDTLRSGPMRDRVGVVLAVDSTGGEHACKAFIDGWSRKGELVSVPVPPLRREDVPAYLQAVFPPIEGLEQHVDVLLAHSGGNPLLLEELLRFMVVRRYIGERNGILAVTSLKADILPHTLEDAVRRRREHLPLETQNLLGQASVQGTRFDLRTVLRMTGESTGALTEALARACETLFIVPEARGVYRFTSEAARQVFYQALPAAQRTALHRKLGTMEEETAARTGEATRTAWHYEQAGDVEKSLEVLARLSHDYLAPRTVEVVVGDAVQFKPFKATNELNPEQLEDGLLALNMLMRCMRSLAVYGEHSPITRTSFGTALSVIDRLVQSTGTLGYTLSEEAFHVNKNRVALEHVPSDFKSLLGRHRISGFEFQPGVSEAEIRAFVDLLMAGRDAVLAAGGWSVACASHGIRHIVVNETVYIGVAEKDLFDASKLRLAEEVVVKPAPSAPAEAVETPRPAAGLDGLEQVLQSVAQHAGSDLVVQHLQTLQAMVAELRRAGPAPAPPAEPAPVAIDPSVSELLRQAKVDEVKRVLALAASVDVPLTAYLASKPEVLLAALEDGNPDRRTAAAMGLARLGKDARRPLLQYLRTSEHPVGRSAAVFVFLRAEADPSLVMAQEVLTCSDAEDAGRLLQAMIEGGMHWTQPLSNLLLSPVTALRRSALQVLVDSAMSTFDKLDLLAVPFASEHLAIVEDAVRAAGELASADVVPPLAALMEKLSARRTPESVRVQEQICHALGRTGSSDALPVVRAAAFRRGFLSGGWDSPVRAAAVYALSQLPGPEAKECLQRLAGDGDANVSGTAKWVLSRPPASSGAERLLQVLASEGAGALEGEFPTPKT